MSNGKNKMVVYTDQQRELIRARVKEYYEFQHNGPVKATWGGICDQIFDETHVYVRPEIVRQWVKQFVQKRRKRPLSPNAEELEAIVSFLMHPDINMLLPQELEDPETPYRFLRSFLEFLRINSNASVSEPPRALGGLYEARYRVDETDKIEEKWIKINLALEIDSQNHIIRATETWETQFRGADENSTFGDSRRNEGWWIVTPEGNLFLLMKTEPYHHNYYYLTIATNPAIGSPVVNNLALLRHEIPANCDLAAKSFDELKRETKQRTIILTFNKVA